MRLPAARALEKIQKGTVAPAYMLIGAELYWRDQIVNGHGAMVALVGCAEYGCHVAA